MKIAHVFGLSAVILISTTTAALANPVPLIATAIQSFLLSSAGVSLATATTIGTVAANAIVLGAVGIATPLVGGYRRGKL